MNRCNFFLRVAFVCVRRVAVGLVRLANQHGQDTLAQVRLLLLLSALVAGGLAALAAAMLMRRALRPVERLSRAAGHAWAAGAGGY